MPDIIPASQGVQATPENSPAPAATSEPLAGNESSTSNNASSTSLEELQRQIAELRRESGGYRRKLREHEDAANATAQKRMAEQGQYKELAEKHEARTKELEPIAERYTALSSLVAEQIKAQVKEWPSEIKAFDPGEDAPIEQRLAWLEKSKPLIEKINAQSRQTSPGNAPNPKASQPTRSQQVDELKSRLRLSGSYGF